MKSKEFNGTIIITDPCYISLKKNRDWGKVFDYDSYVIRDSNFSKYIWTYTGVGDGIFGVSIINDKILNRVDLENYTEDLEKAYKQYLDHPSNINNRISLEKLTKRQENIGKFGIDSGTFGVFYLSEVLSYNPRFLVEHGSGLYTIIQDFVGTIDVFGNKLLGLGNKTFFTYE